MIIQKQHSRGALGKGVLKICNKLTKEYPWQSMIPIKLLGNFIEMTLRHGCSPVSLQYIFRTPFYKNTHGGMLLITHNDALKRKFVNSKYEQISCRLCSFFFNGNIVSGLSGLLMNKPGIFGTSCLKWYAYPQKMELGKVIK